MVARFQKAQRADEQSSDEPGAAESADQACFGQGFQVIVVGMIHDFSVVQGFVRRIHLLQSSQTRSQHRMIQKNLPRAVAHRSALALRYFQSLQTREARKYLVNSEPRHREEGQHENNSASHQMASR